jgi:hypothetical protein
LIKTVTFLSVSTSPEPGRIYQLQHLEGTKVWALVGKPELNELIEKARRYSVLEGQLGEDPLEYHKQRTAKPTRRERVE